MRKIAGDDGFVSGFVAIVGRPNVGKSTFLNGVVGEKAAIISDKPQTTRNKIRAVLTTNEAQVIFIDTPGIHKPKNRLGQMMVRGARSVLSEVDVILFVTDAGFEPGRGDAFVADCFKGVETPVYLILNKTDLVSSAQGEARLARYEELYPFAASFMVAALQKAGLKDVVDELIKHLPAGPCYYPPDMVIDRPEYFLVAEFIREKVLHLTREEVPYSIGVMVEEMKKKPHQDIVEVRALIMVERKSQKGIIIGKGGSMLKEIGSRARTDIQNILGSQVYLELWVKVSPDWRNREFLLQEMGYREE